MSFHCIKLLGLFQIPANFTKFRQGNQGIIRGFFFRHLAGNPESLIVKDAKESVRVSDILKELTVA